MIVRNGGKTSVAMLKNYSVAIAICPITVAAQENTSIHAQLKRLQAMYMYNRCTCTCPVSCRTVYQGTAIVLDLFSVL